MKDELWLKKIKERLDDYSEPLPDDGWERLEKVLQPSSVRMKRIIPFRRWAVAAAVVLLLVVSSVGVWLLQSPVADEIRHTNTPALAVVPDQLPVQAPESEQTAMPTSVDYDRSRTQAETLPENVLAQHLDKEEAVVNEAVETVVDDILPQQEEEESEAADNRMEDGVSSEKGNKTADYRRSVRKDPLNYRPEKKRAKAKGWSVGLSVGNTGGNLADNGDGGIWMQDYSVSTVPYGSRVDLASVSNAVVTIPEGQEVVFQEGIPYLLGRSRDIESVDHKQPVSVGISFRKGLPYGFSLETGLTYTYLASDVKYAGSAEIVNQKLHYIGIPLRANWNFIDTRTFTVYIAAGGAVEKCVYGKIGSERETVEPLQFSVLGAVGAQLNLTNRLGLYVEPGISYFFDDGSDVQTIRKENPCNFTLQAGLRLSY